MKYITLLLAILLGAIVVFAQDPPTPAKVQPGEKLSGSYEGIVKGQTEKVSLHLKVAGPKLSGLVQVGEKSYELTQGGVTEKTITVFFKEGNLVGEVNGDTLTGYVQVGAEKKAIELKRVPPVPAVPAVPATPDAKFVPNGQWEAVADANGQPFPFLLTLKVEGETVTGNSSSQLGDAALKDGSWKDGKLSFVIEGSNGNISMVATVVDGKLSGEFDYAGQLQGKWVAVRKN